MPSPGDAPYVWIPMADGTCLSVRLFLPDGDDGPWPVLLEALPYRKDDLTASYSSEYRRLRDEGRFAVARVDLRGTGASEGLRRGRVPRAGAGRSRRGDRVARGRAVVERQRRDVRHVVLRLQLAAARGRATARARGDHRHLRVRRPVHRRRPLHGRRAQGRRPRRLRALHDGDGGAAADARARRARSGATRGPSGSTAPSRGCCAGSKSSGTGRTGATARCGSGTSTASGSATSASRSRR